jgi:hypothetical protein
MGADRNITPTTKPMEGSPAGTTTESASLGGAAGSESGDAERSTTTTDRIIPAETDTVEISNSTLGIGGRWDTFPSRLRQRRKEAELAARLAPSVPFPSATAPIPSARLFSAYSPERSHGKATASAVAFFRPPITNRWPLLSCYAALNLVISTF